MKHGVPYCCHIEDDGTPCPNDAAFEVFEPPQTYDNYTHVCADHLAEVKCDKDMVVELEKR